MNSSLPLRIELAGFNVDRETLRGLEIAAYEGGEAPPREAITPETLSAAYARISRNPSDIREIRAEARVEVEKARRSNENIVFGLGHSSVAEHAVFNMDVTGISRLAVEAIERHRLTSFTEKSQRYIKLDGDAVIAPEIHQAGLAAELDELIREQNKTYWLIEAALYQLYLPRFQADGEGRPKTRARGKAAEDARYVVSLATQAQFGMTVNARTLETMIRDALAYPLEEVREAGRQLLQQVQGLAPSLVKYTDATDYEQQQFSRCCYWPESQNAPDSGQSTVRLVDYSENGESLILASLLLHNTGCSWTEAHSRASKMPPEERKSVYREMLKPNAPWDPPPREFELAEFTFELILSAAAFGQLKRHRMSTQILGPYDPSLGWTMPETVAEANMTREFDAILERSAEFAWKIATHASEGSQLAAAAPYALCNAHRRRIVFKANARELYHVSRLREDEHAQWDIRQLAGAMVQQAREVMPALFIMATGKHEFAERKRTVFGK
ncbi:FAD-dependent thymidylate synthase [bacterium]|nr:FAD-dependent thymidylate synthase [bacterium]